MHFEQPKHFLTTEKLKTQEINEAVQQSFKELLQQATKLDEEFNTLTPHDQERLTKISHTLTINPRNWFVVSEQRHHPNVVSNYLKSHLQLINRAYTHQPAVAQAAYLAEITQEFNDALSELGRTLKVYKERFL